MSQNHIFPVQAVARVGRLSITCQVVVVRSAHRKNTTHCWNCGNSTCLALTKTHEIRQSGMLRVGMLKIDVARRFNCHVSTITRLQMRFQQTGGVADRPRPGRPRVTTPGQDNHIRLSHLRNRFLPASETARQTIGRHGFVKVT